MSRPCAASWTTCSKAKRDSRIKTVLLMPSGLQLPYWGKVQELRDAVLDFRKSGKRVVAFLEYGGDREYYLASAADKVYLLPSSPLDLTGVASYEIFLRGAFDKVGAYPDFLHVGDYKSAANQLTEKGFTPAHREMTESLNRDMYEQLVRGIAREPEEERAGRARAARSGAVRARRGPESSDWLTTSPTRIELTTASPTLGEDDDGPRRRAAATSASRPRRSASARARASRCCMRWARSRPAGARSIR